MKLVSCDLQCNTHENPMDPNFIGYEIGIQLPWRHPLQLVLCISAHSSMVAMTILMIIKSASNGHFMQA